MSDNYDIEVRDAVVRKVFGTATSDSAPIPGTDEHIIEVSLHGPLFCSIDAHAADERRAGRWDVSSTLIKAKHEIQRLQAEQVPEHARNMACARCNVKDCEFRWALYNLDCEPCVDCLGTK